MKKIHLVIQLNVLKSLARLFPHEPCTCEHDFDLLRDVVVHWYDHAVCSGRILISAEGDCARLAIDAGGMFLTLIGDASLARGEGGRFWALSVDGGLGQQVVTYPTPPTFRLGWPVRMDKPGHGTWLAHHLRQDDHRARLPVRSQGLDETALHRRLRHAVGETLRAIAAERLSVAYGFFRQKQQTCGAVNIHLPIWIGRPLVGCPDLVLPLEVCDGFYRAHTGLTPRMSYVQARCLGIVTVDWLRSAGRPWHDEARAA